MQKKHNEQSSSKARSAPVMRKEREALEFLAIGRGKNACFPWKWASGKKFLLTLECFL
jgi:hypothetical protein